MGIRVVRFCALVFAALALVPAGAHLAALPNKISLPAADYLTVQQVYSGWALFGVVVLGALIFTLLLAIETRGTGRPCHLALAAFLCIAGTQLIFWLFTFPANQATANWTTLPPDWIALRAQWEYSHAASAILNLAALVALVLSAFGSRESEPRRV